MATAQVTLASGGTPQFVGRIRELQWLGDLLTSAGQGDARLGLVGGEPGVGKTSLVRAFLAEADAAGWQTVWGRCSEDGGTPHQPFAAGLIPQLKKAGIAPQDTGDGRSLLQGEDLHAVAEALAGWSVALAARRPLVFVIDDFQFGEPETLTLIREFVRNLSEVARREPLRALVLVTHHPPLPGDRFGPFLERLRVEPISSSLELGGLSELEAHELIRQQLATNCDPRLLGALLEATHGNPFFLLQVLRHLERGRLLVRDGAYVTTKTNQFDLHLPASAASSVAKRLEDSDRQTLRPIETAALLGDEFEFQDLAPFHSEIELEAAIDHGISAGLLVETAQGFGFSHGIIRAAIVEAIGPMRRRKAHAAIADSLMGRYGDAPERSLEIAHHVTAAGKWRDDVQAGAVFERAGDFAMDSFLWSAGHRNYEAALSLPAYVESLDPAARGRLYQNTARANSNNGNRERSRELNGLAVQQLREAGEIEQWGRALLNFWRTFTNANQPLPDDGAYEEFLGAAGDRFLEVRAQLLMHRAESLLFARDPRDEEVGRQARALAAQSADPETRAYAANIMGLIHNRHLRPAEAIADFEEAERHSRLIRNPRIKGWAASRMPMPLITMGDLRAARAACAEARALSDSGHDLSNGPLNLAFFHITAVLGGDFGQARTLRIEAAMSGRRSSDPAAAFLLDAAVAWERILRGEYGEAEDALESWARSAGPFVPRSTSLLLGARSGHGNAVLDDLGARPLAFGTAGVDFSNAGAIAAAVELADELKLTELAARAFELLEPVARRDVRFSMAPPILLPRVVATAARLTGRMEEAAAFLEQADTAAREAQAEPERGLVALERAKLLAATNARPSDVRAAVLAASEVFRRLDMVGAAAVLREFVETAGIAAQLPALLPAVDDLSATEFEVLEEFSRDHDVAYIADRLLIGSRTVEGHLSRLARRLGVTTAESARAFLRAVRPGPPQASGQSRNPALAELTHRELEVLALVARGLTNQQIADELVISLHTAIRHVANILGKTGAANRTEAARLVVRH